MSPTGPTPIRTAGANPVNHYPQQATEIQAIELAKTYQGPGGPVTALAPTTLDIRQGEFVCFLGPSGCGKTTLLRMFGGLLPPTSGQVVINGEPLWKEGRRDDSVIGELGFVFQDASLFPWRVVRDNVALPLELRGMGKRERHVRAHELLELVGLSGFETSRPDQLSGGMQQRVAIARALAHEPDILLMDEPFGALDAMTREQMNLELQRLWLETKRTILLVTHSISEAVMMADRVVSLSPRPGRVARVTEVSFERPRTPDINRNVEFQDLVLELRELLQEGDDDASTRQ